jgi:pimeloyl-ACP methyl ester carboxylesterase
VLIHGLPRHSGDKKSFYGSRAWHYWREAEQLFLSYLKEEEKPIALVGYSTGANVVLTIAARHPGKVAGIILLSPYLRSRSTTTRMLSYGISGLYYFGLPLCALGGIAYAFRKQKRDSWSKGRAIAIAAGSLLGFAAVEKSMSMATLSIGEAPTMMRDGEEVRAPHFERISMIGGSTLVPFQLITRWVARKTVVPVTYIFGGKDHVVDVKHGVMVAQKNPQADLFVLSNAQHRITTEPGVWDLVCASILKSFDEHSSRRQEFADVDEPHDLPQPAKIMV